jgi:hypothetical protein
MKAKVSGPIPVLQIGSSQYEKATVELCSVLGTRVGILPTFFDVMGIPERLKNSPNSRH